MKEIEISKLTFLKHNVREHTPEQLKALEESIKEFGFINPVVIDEKNVILVGNGRTEAAKNCGIEKVPYIRVKNLSEDQKRAFVIIENKLTEGGSWNYELLNSELEAIGMDMRRFGFDVFENSEIVSEDEMSQSFKNTNTEFDGGFEDECFDYECENCGFRFNV